MSSLGGTYPCICPVCPSVCNAFWSQWMWKVIFWIWLVRSWPRVLLASPHESVALIFPIIVQQLQNLLDCFVSFAHTLAVPDKIFVSFSSQNIKVIIVINTLDMVWHWSSSSLSTSLTHYHRHQHQYFHKLTNYLMYHRYGVELDTFTLLQTTISSIATCAGLINYYKILLQFITHLSPFFDPEAKVFC